MYVCQCTKLARDTLTGRALIPPNIAPYAPHKKPKSKTARQTWCCGIVTTAEDAAMGQMWRPGS